MNSRIGDVEAPGVFVKRLESIHIMRGFAACVVMMCHLTAANDNINQKLPLFSSLFSYGDLGIWMFFVISGFVIPFSMKAIDYRFPRGAWPFFLRRIVRLEPPYVASVLLAYVIAYAAARTPGYRGGPFDPDLVTFLTQFIYLAPWFDKPWINGVAWTLAIEFQYYILMLFVGPLLLSGAKIKLLLFFALVIASSLLVSDQRAVFYYLPCFALGFAAFLYYDRQVDFASFAVLAVIFAALANYNLGWAPAIVAVGSAGAIFLPIRKPVPLLSFLGSISYSVYLVHTPVGDRLINLSTRLPNIGWLQLLGVAVAVGGSVGVSYLLWHYVERPATQLAKRISTNGITPFKPAEAD